MKAKRNLKDYFIKPKEQTTTNSFITGSTNYISAFGDDIYNMDTARQALERITFQMCKLDPRHIRRDRETGVVTHIKSDINNVLHSPNIYMTTADFIKKQIYGLYKYDNYYIFPHWRINDNNTRTLIGLYPIETNNIEFVRGIETGDLYIKFRYYSGYEATLRYEELIHIRRNFTEHEIEGGNKYGKPDRSGLLTTCQVQDQILKGVAKQSEVASKFVAIVSGDSYLSEAELKKMRSDFLDRIENGDSAFLFNDKKQEVTQFRSDTKMIDTETIKFLNQKILHDFGVSLPIWEANFNADQLTAFNEITLEPLIVTINQAYTKALLTNNERLHGNEIVFYHNRLQDADIKSKIEIIEKVGGRGALSNDEIRELLGMPPLGGERGATYMQSLNYIDTKNALQYQLKGNNQIELTQHKEINNNNNEGVDNGEETK